MIEIGPSGPAHLSSSQDGWGCPSSASRSSFPIHNRPLRKSVVDSSGRLAVAALDQRGLAPVAIGLMISGTYTIARLSVVDLPTLAIAVVVFGILTWRHVNPGILVLLGGAVYMLAMR